VDGAAHLPVEAVAHGGRQGGPVGPVAARGREPLRAFRPRRLEVVEVPLLALRGRGGQEAQCAAVQSQCSHSAVTGQVISQAECLLAAL
jgi:hypothetical protein